MATPDPNQNQPVLSPHPVINTTPLTLHPHASPERLPPSPHIAQNSLSQQKNEVGSGHFSETRRLPTVSNQDTVVKSSNEPVTTVMASPSLDTPSKQTPPIVPNSAEVRTIGQMPPINPPPLNHTTLVTSQKSPIGKSVVAVVLLLILAAIVAGGFLWLSNRDQSQPELLEESLPTATPSPQPTSLPTPTSTPQPSPILEATSSSTINNQASTSGALIGETQTLTNETAKGGIIPFLTPTPSPTATPKPTPATVEEVDLPEAGSFMPTLAVAVLGSFILIAGISGLARR